jgi:hypothetical protein
MLREKQKRAANKLANEIDLGIDNNNNVVDVNNNIILARDSSSDTSNNKINTVTKPSTPVLTIPTSNSKRSSTPSSTNTTTQKNIVRNHSTSTPHIRKSITTDIKNKEKRKRDKKVPHNSKILQSNVPKSDYIEEFPENSSDKQYSDDDIDGNNDEYDIDVDDAAETVAKTVPTKITKEKTQENKSDHPPPTSNPGAFESDAVLPAQNNN